MFGKEDKMRFILVEAEVFHVVVDSALLFAVEAHNSLAALVFDPGQMFVSDESRLVLVSRSDFRDHFFVEGS